MELAIVIAVVAVVASLPFLFVGGLIWLMVVGRMRRARLWSQHGRCRRWA